LSDAGSGEETMEPKDTKKKTGKLDRIDSAIISLLKRDGKLTNMMLAKELGVSEATIRNRLTRLFKEEYIQIIGVSNPLKLGFEIIGIIKIQVDIKRQEAVGEALKKIKPIWSIAHTLGGTDIYAEVAVESIEELNNLILKELSSIDGIIRTETSLIAKYVKRDYAWGAGLI
jgi:Lrp/AsnC family transcriptional regulator for asnA, asnC and gidA